MLKRCTCLFLLVAVLTSAFGGVSQGAFNALKDPALVGWWSFDEGTGDTAADSSPYGRDGQLRGGATWTPGRFGGGIQLNGTSAYVAVPSFPVTTGGVTMVAWVNGWKANNWAALVTGHPARLEMCFGDNNTLHYAWNNDSSATWSWAGAPVIPQDTWAMVAITIDAAQAIAWVYTDAGGLSQAANTMAHIQQTYSTLQIGWSFDTRYVRGIMDEVAVYSGEKRLAVHGRKYGNNHWVLEADHYLELLRQRPGAFRDARPLSEWKKTWSSSLNSLLERFQERQGENGGIKEFIDVLLLIRNYGQKRVEDAVEQALENGLGSAAGIRHLLESAEREEETILPLESERWTVLPAADVSAYSVLEAGQ